MDKNKMIGKMLKEKRKENGYSLEDISYILKNRYKVELDNSNISRYEAGTVKNMNPIYLKALCKANDIDYIKVFEELGFIDEFPKEKSNLIMPDEELILIPVMAKASAGNGYINFSNEPLYNKLIRKNGFNEKCYLIEVVGDSMEPLIQDGSYVVIDPYQTEYIENKIYVVKYDEEMYIKRVIVDIESNLMILKSVNPEYKDIYITAEKGDMVQILGRAVKYIFEGNL